MISPAVRCNASHIVFFHLCARLVELGSESWAPVFNRCGGYVSTINHLGYLFFPRQVLKHLWKVPFFMIWIRIEMVCITLWNNWQSPNSVPLFLIFVFCSSGREVYLSFLLIIHFWYPSPNITCHTFWRKQELLSKPSPFHVHNLNLTLCWNWK